MSAKERKRKSANARKRAQKVTKGRKRASTLQTTRSETTRFGNSQNGIAQIEKTKVTSKPFGKQGNSQKTNVTLEKRTFSWNYKRRKERTIVGCRRFCRMRFAGRLLLFLFFFGGGGCFLCILLVAWFLALSLGVELKATSAPLIVLHVKTSIELFKNGKENKSPKNTHGSQIPRIGQLKGGNGRGGFQTQVWGTMFFRNGGVTPGPSRECNITFFVKQHLCDSTVAARRAQNRENVTVPSSRVTHANAVPPG